MEVSTNKKMLAFNFFILFLNRLCATFEETTKKALCFFRMDLRTKKVLKGCVSYNVYTVYL